VSNRSRSAQDRDFIGHVLARGRRDTPNAVVSRALVLDLQARVPVRKGRTRRATWAVFSRSGTSMIVLLLDACPPSTLGP
jgi:hypothetical protein